MLLPGITKPVMTLVLSGAMLKKEVFIAAIENLKGLGPLVGMQADGLVIPHIPRCITKQLMLSEARLVIIRNQHPSIMQQNYNKLLAIIRQGRDRHHGSIRVKQDLPTAENMRKLQRKLLKTSRLKIRKHLGSLLVG